MALFEKMKKSEFAEGVASLRAKIDMASPFMVIRDPVLYRVNLQVIIKQVINGAFTQCTILLIAFPMH